VNLVDKNGKSAIFYAIEKSYSHIFTLLIDHGADVNIVDNFGISAKDYAIRGKRHKMIAKINEKEVT